MEFTVSIIYMNLTDLTQNDAAVIAGVAVGALIGVILIIVVVVLMILKNRRCAKHTLNGELFLNDSIKLYKKCPGFCILIPVEPYWLFYIHKRS